MPKFTKDVLYPGTYRLADGRKVTYTREDCRHLAQRLADMKAAGLGVPVCWEHQDVEPADRLAHRAKGTLGWADEAKVAPDGYLEFGVDVPVQADADRMPAVRFVSPEISTDWTDGTGRLWPGKSITHLAVTPHPVQPGQKPFAARLSRGGKVSDKVRLSLGDVMPDEKDDKKNDKPKDKAGADKPSADGSLSALIEALKEKGFMVPDEVASLEDLVIAVKAGSPGGAGDAPPPPPEEPVAEASPVMMSLTKRVVDMERDKLSRRIDALKDRIGGKLAGELKAELSRERLSLDGEAKLKAGALLVRIEAYERLAGGFKPGGKPSRLSLAGEDAEEAADARGAGKAPESAEEVAEAVAAWDEMMGRKKA